MDGLAHVELVDHRPGTGWVAERLHELTERHSPTAVVVDPGSAAAALLPAIEAAGIRVVKPNAREVAGGAGTFYDLTRPEVAGLRHVDQVPLSSAVAGAVRRPLGDAWTWSRRGSTVVVSPLVSAGLALWGHFRSHGLQLIRVPRSR